MDKVMSLIKEKKYLGIIGYSFIIIGAFLPLVTVSVSFLGVSNSQSVSWAAGNGGGADGIIAIILCVIGLLMIFADKLSDKVTFFGKLVNPKLTLIPTVLTAILLIIDMSSVSGSGLGALANISWGFGFWVIVIGLVAAVAYPFVYKGENK